MRRIAAPVACYLFGFLGSLALFGCAGERVKHFPNYQEAFRYIAKAEGLPDDPETALKLAVDSGNERMRLTEQPESWVLICAAQYYDENLHSFTLRGAQGNGRYYALRPTTRGVELIAIMEGNMLDGHWTNGRLHVRTCWHMSASVSGCFEYEWDGQILAAVERYDLVGGVKTNIVRSRNGPESPNKVQRLEH